MTYKKTVLISLFLFMFSSITVQAAAKDYSNAAGGWTDDGITIELALGADSEENGYYSRYLGMFIDDGECYSGVCATADIDLHLINAGHHWTFSDNADFIVEGGYIGYEANARACASGYCSSETVDDSGYNIMAGFRTGNPEGIEFKILIGRGDVEDAFTMGQAEINYNFSPGWSAYLGLIHLDGDNQTTVGFKYDF
tara:strand:- start:106 stop:696 length:591 start_codon:yes stop_codon:yes gene_type:complete